MGCPLVVTMDGGDRKRDREYLQARRDLRAERSDKSDEDRDFHCAGIRRKHRYGFGEDEGRYSERKNLRLCESVKDG